MTHAQTRTVSCPICGATAEATCHVVEHTGHPDAREVLLDGAKCPSETDEGHGPVAADEWAGAWIAAGPPSPEIL